MAEMERRWINGDRRYAPAGAESFHDVEQRILPTWHRLAEQGMDQTTVVVAHGGVIRILLLSLNLGGTDRKAIRTPNLGIHELVLESVGWRLVRTADVPEVVRRVT